MAKYIRVPINSRFFKPNPNLCIFLSRDLLFRRFLFLSFIKSTIENRSLKALHPFLSCGGLESRLQIWESFGRLQFRLQVKYICGSKQNVLTPAPDITNVTVLVRISPSVHFTFTYVKFTSLSKPGTPYL